MSEEAITKTIPAWIAEAISQPRCGCPVRDSLIPQVMMARHGRSSRSTGWAYASPADFVYSHGRAAESRPLTSDEHAVVAEAQRVAALTALRLDRPWLALKACFLNAALLVLSDGSFPRSLRYVPRSLRYVEGYAIGNSIPVHHAWAEINGAVVDLTWGPARTPPSDLGVEDLLVWDGDGGWRARVLGKFPPSWRYVGVDLTSVLGDSESFGSSFIDNWKDDYPLLQQPWERA